MRCDSYQRQVKVNVSIIMATEPTGNVGTKLLFENERIRVWDLALQPGEALEKHVHHEDYVFIVLEGGSLVHVDDEDAGKDVAVHYIRSCGSKPAKVWFTISLSTLATNLTEI